MGLPVIVAPTSKTLGQVWGLPVIVGPTSKTLGQVWGLPVIVIALSPLFSSVVIVFIVILTYVVCLIDRCVV